VNDGTIDRGRRNFFSRVLREQVLEPVAEARREQAMAARLEEFERVYESELMAFGPDVLADAAQRSGIDSGDTNYAQVAKVFARKMEKKVDES
jgi:hypothetical protein